MKLQNLLGIPDGIGLQMKRFNWTKYIEWINHRIDVGHTTTDPSKSPETCVFFVFFAGLMGSILVLKSIYHIQGTIGWLWCHLNWLSNDHGSCTWLLRRFGPPDLSVTIILLNIALWLQFTNLYSENHTQKLIHHLAFFWPPSPSHCGAALPWVSCSWACTAMAATASKFYVGKGPRFQGRWTKVRNDGRMALSFFHRIYINKYVYLLGDLWFLEDEAQFPCHVSPS